jgi:hypothetical protein
MRRLVRVMMLALLPATAMSQQSATPLPSDVRREVVDRYNGPNEFRSIGRTEIGDAQDVQGNLAVLHGPLFIAGRVTGDVLVVNGDVILRPSARIHGDLLVVGGNVEGRSSSQIDGTTRIYRSPLVFREETDRIVAVDDEQRDADENWWRKLERHRQSGGNWTEALRVVQAGPYNRVEGLPIQLGPSLERRTSWGSLAFDGAAIVRTASSFASDKGDIGHTVRAEARIGHERGIGVGGRLFNVVDPIERWQLSNLETALAAFVVRRDYRDYFGRHGGNAYVTLYGARNLSLTGSFGEERWTSRGAHNPFTVFNGEHAWRANPPVDEGLFHIADLALKFDTRTDIDNPWSGWYVDADVEHGNGNTDYARGLFDIRRYNRLGPKAQLNMRVVLGGWMGGDELPLERRLSVDGPGAVPAYGFRGMPGDTDVGTCNRASGSVVAAQCDRIALAQVEYRGDLNLDFTGDWQDWPRRYRSAHGDISWVLFADAGRGWQVNSPISAQGLTYSTGSLPPLSTFRSDIGVGLDIAGIGLYAAKTMSSPDEPVKFFMRLRHRF